MIKAQREEITQFPSRAVVFLKGKYGISFATATVLEKRVNNYVVKFDGEKSKDLVPQEMVWPLHQFSNLA